MRKPPHRSLSFLLGVFSLSIAASAAALEIPEDPNPPRVTFLDNGLEVAVKRVAGSQSVSCQLWVRSGSVTEGENLGSGMSHYLEHMLFKGTSRRGVGEIAREVERLGGEINAYTSFDRTVFTINLPAAHLEKGLDILADAAQNALFDPAEFEKERNVILQEFSFSEDDPEKSVSRLLWATAFRVHPARHPVIGYRPLFEKLTRDDVIAYYRKNYVPNNMLLVVAGGVEPQPAAALIEKIFGPLERRSLPPETLPSEPPQLGARAAEKRMDVGKAYFYMGFHGPTVWSPDVAPLDVLAEILGGGKSSRLYQRVREGKHLAYSIDAWSYTGKDYGLFAVGATLAPENVEKLKEAVWEELRRLQKEGVSEEELQIARASLLKTLLSSRETAADQAGSIGSNLFVAQAADYDAFYIGEVARVTPDQVRKIALKYFSPEKESVSVIRPAPAAAAAREDETAAVAGETRIRKRVFPNGMTLLSRADPSLPLVTLRAVWKGGVLSESAETSGVSHMMTQLFLKGTRAKTQEEFLANLEKLGGAISPYTGYNSFGVEIQLLPAHWKEGLALLAELVQSPRFEAADLEKERKVILAGIRAREDEPFDAAGKLLRETLYASHPYRLQTYGTPESVAGLEITDVEENYRRYVRPQNTVLAVFGPAPEAQIERETARLFEKFRAPASPEFPKKTEPPQNRPRREEKIKQTQQTVIGLGFHTVDMFSPDQYPLEIIASLYSGQGSRLFKSVREELGLAYTVGCYQVLGLDPGYFAFYAGCRPDKAAEVLGIVWDEIGKLKAGGISAEELERAQNGLVWERARELEKSSNLAFKVALDELYGLGYDDFEKYERRIRGVTADDVMRVARKYFTEENSALAEVKPE